MLKKNLQFIKYLCKYSRLCSCLIGEKSFFKNMERCHQKCKVYVVQPSRYGIFGADADTNIRE